MAKRKLPYSEGDYFAIPLRDSGYAIGIVARQSEPKPGILLGYFFGPKQSSVPTLNELKKYTASDAILVEMFVDMGLKKGTWPIIGKHPSWNKNEWPMPIFQKTGLLNDKLYKVYYPDNPGALGTEEVCPSNEEEQVRQFPQDGLSGHGAIELILTKILSGSKLVT